jgi:type IV secretion system protein VirB10
MFEQKLEAPVAEEERQGLVERKRAVAPGQKLILVATSSVAALLIVFGIASRNNFFGLFGAPAPAKTDAHNDIRPLAAPEVKVPLALGPPPSAPSSPPYVECPGGLRLPIGLNCPEPEKKAEAAQPPAQGGMSEEDRIRERRRKSAITLATTQPPAAAAGAASQMGSVAATAATGATAGLPGASTP